MKRCPEVFASLATSTEHAKQRAVGTDHKTLDRTATLGVPRETRKTERTYLWDPIRDIFFFLPRSKVVCGKDPSCDVCLPYPTVSRLHAQIEHGPTGWRMVDLGSRNGIFYMNHRVTQCEMHMHTTILLGAQPLVITPEPASEKLQKMYISFHTRTAELCRELENARTVAENDSPVLIYGETGTGKEWLSRFIHEHSKRRGRLVAINCGALPRELLESELFGHVRGAFTGADGARTGLVAQAIGGTLFLDEIAEIPIEQQAALLRFLENHTYRPVGSDRELKADTRIVAASHANLPLRVARGLFREDLLYRLLEIRLELPPLARRKLDFPLLMHCFGAPPVDAHVWAQLLSYSWPGNLRQLRHVCTQARCFGWERALTDLQNHASHPPSETIMASVPDSPARLKDLERAMIEEALRRAGHNTSAAARALGLPRSTLVNRMRALGMP